MTDAIEIAFFVPGVPATAGSRRPFLNRKTGVAFHIDDCVRAKPWRRAVQKVASKAMFGPPHEGAVIVHVTFYFARPKNHFRTGKFSRVVRDDAPRYHVIKPDLDKLQRALGDALSGICYGDDCQIVSWRPDKVYGDMPGARVVIQRADELEAG